MSIASHHQHIRKRGSKDSTDFPSKDPKIRTLDSIVTVISFAFPLSALPQIYNIWFLKTESDRY